MALIFLFLLTEGLPAFARSTAGDLVDSRAGTRSRTILACCRLIGGSLIVTLGAALIAMPIGVGTAIYIAEVAPRWAREILKPLIEVLAGIPSVVLGFIGMLDLAPCLRRLLDLPTGLDGA